MITQQEALQNREIPSRICDELHILLGDIADLSLRQKEIARIEKTLEAIAAMARYGFDVSLEAGFE